MDTVTHALAGLCIAASLPRTVRGPDTTVVVVAASLLPDIDVLWSLSEPATAALGRHMLTHSLVGVAMLSAGFGALAWLLARRLSLLLYVGLVTLAVVAHIGLDLINAYGVALLYPWSAARFELPLAFILDPMLTGLLLVGVLLAAIVRNPDRAAYASWAALLLVGCYLTACFWLRTGAEQMVAAHASTAGGGPWTYLVPELGSPLRWKGIYRDGNNYRQMLVHPLSGRITDLATVRSTPNDALVAAARATAAGRRIDAFLKVPVWRADADTVVAYDLRFRFASLGNDWDPFGFCFRKVGEGLELVREDLNVYLANWRNALSHFALKRPAEPVATSCHMPQAGLAKQPR